MMDRNGRNNTQIMDKDETKTSVEKGKEDVYQAPEYFEDSDSETDELLSDYNRCSDRFVNLAFDDLEDGRSHYIPTFITLLERKVEKEGFLFKQGGANLNQGWKKRWITFDEKSLKYFTDPKATESKRIIPVSIMEGITHVTETTMARSSFSTSRQHQFTLQCKGRTFLFGTDDLTNCQKWESSLMEAIIKKDKNNTSEETNGKGAPEKPDICGALRLNRNRGKHFVALNNNKLSLYYNEDEHTSKMPMHELGMSLVNVQEVPDSRFKLQIRSPPNQKYIFNFDTVEDKEEWKTALEESIACSHGDNEIVDQVRKIPGNIRCADCECTETNWASLNYGVVLCMKCAGIHRGLGVTISKIQSLRMDNIFKANKNIVELLLAIGNENANNFWYKYPIKDRHIDSTTYSVIRKKHIHQKYVGKQFCDRTFLDKSQSSLNEDFLKAVIENDLLKVMHALYSGAEISCKREENNRDAFELAESVSNIILKEFLVQNRHIDTKCHIEVQKKQVSAEVKAKAAVYMEDSLEKTGPNLKGFQKRLFILHYGCIRYFERNKEKGCIDVGDIVSVSTVRCNNRQFTFEITCKEKNLCRLYRLAAPSMDVKINWMNAIAQTISSVNTNEVVSMPLQLCGKVFVKVQLDRPWTISELLLGQNDLVIKDKDDGQEPVAISLREGVTVYKFNVGKTSKNEGKGADIKTLDGNQTVELVKSAERLMHIQGLYLRDTEKVFTLLNQIVNG